MKNFYDKLLLIASALLFAGGLTVFLVGGGAKLDKSLESQQPTGPDYEPIAVAEADIRDAEWKEVEPQDSEGFWVYDIFTPPKIYWHMETQTFRAEPPEPPEPPKPPVPFNVFLTGIEREKYRIQFEAYFGKKENARIQFINVETGESVRGKVGKTFPKHKFRIFSFDVVKEITEEGLISRQPKVVIFDEETQKLMNLTSEPLYLPGQVAISFESESTGDVYTVNSKGESFSVGDDVYVVEDFDFDNQTATVKKTSPELEEPETKTLSVTTADAIAGSSNPENDNSQLNGDASDASTESFDGFFN